MIAMLRTTLIIDHHFFSLQVVLNSLVNSNLVKFEYNALIHEVTTVRMKHKVLHRQHIQKRLARNLYTKRDSMIHKLFTFPVQNHFRFHLLDC